MTTQVQRLSWRNLPNRLGVVGDSIALGRTAQPGSSWCERLHKKHVSNDLAANMVFNLGIGGNTSRDVLRRLPQEFAERNIEASMLLVGVNDLRVSTHTKAQDVPIDEFRDNYLHIVKKCLSFGPLEIIGLVPMGFSGSNVLGDFEYSQEEWELYNATIHEVASDNDVHVTNINAAFNGSSNLHYDPIHPNTKGHEVIFQQLNKSLNE